MIKLVCLVFIVSVIIFQGCGSVSVPSSFVVDETRQIDVLATDGVLKNVRVRLASLLRGTISKAVQTDNQGRATIVVPLGAINQLEDHDLTYFYVESVLGSTVNTNSATNSDKSLEVGQVRLKSYIGSALNLKDKAKNYENLNDDPETNRRSVISHFSNSIAAMIEAEMKRDGLINTTVSPEAPEKNFSVSTLNRAETQRLLLQGAQTDKDSPLGKKLKLLSIATKALVELGISNFLDDGKNLTLSDGSEAILDLAVNSVVALDSSFVGQITPLSSVIEDEVKNNAQIRAGFDNPEEVSKAIDFLSVQDVIESTSVAEIFLDVTVSESLSSSSPYKHVDKVVDLSREIRGGEFIGNSFAPSSEGSFVYNP